MIQLKITELSPRIKLLLLFFIKQKKTPWGRRHLKWRLQNLWVDTFSSNMKIFDTWSEFIPENKYITDFFKFGKLGLFDPHLQGKYFMISFFLEGKIFWSQPARVLFHLVRELSPYQLFDPNLQGNYFLLHNTNLCFGILIPTCKGIILKISYPMKCRKKIILFGILLLEIIFFMVASGPGEKIIVILRIEAKLTARKFFGRFLKVILLLYWYLILPSGPY